MKFKEEKKGSVAMIILGVIAILGLFLFMGGCSSYNNLVALDEGVNQQAAQVETVLQRRYDLIPNLVSTVKGYADFESETLQEVTRLRSQWGAAGSTSEKVAVSNQLESALGRLMVVVEKYPDLKANQGFLNLQSQLEGTENRIAVERRRYNESVASYNATVRRLPARIYAAIFGFEAKQSYFESTQGAENAPKVEF